MRTKAMLAASFLWLGAALAGAQPADRPGGPWKGPGVHGGRMARALELTDEQKAAFQKQMEQQRPQMQALHEQMRAIHEKLQAALAAESPEPAAVGQLVIQENALRKQARTQREQASQALRALLTPEQQAKFDALQSLRDEGFGPRGMGRRGFGHGPGAPPAPPQQ
jgi:Spy/CpxP family protein refolding chaperone